MIEYKIKSFDDALINIREYNEIQKPDGVIQLIHGMGEDASSYDELARFFNSKNFIVFIQDLRAHGKNVDNPKRVGTYDGDIFQDSMKDTVYFAKNLKEKYNLPLILIGHNFGSFIANRSAQLADEFDSLILSGSGNFKKDFSFYLGTAISNIGWLVKGRNTKARMLHNATIKKYNRKFKDKNWLTTDPKMQEELKSSPGFTNIFSYNFYKYLFKGIFETGLNRNLSKIDPSLPILLISGRKDPLNKDGELVSSLKRSLKNAGIKKVEKKVYDKKRHAILNEDIREKVYEHLYDFIVVNNVIKKKENTNVNRDNKKGQPASTKRKKQNKKVRT